VNLETFRSLCIVAPNEVRAVFAFEAVQAIAGSLMRMMQGIDATVGRASGVLLVESRRLSATNIAQATAADLAPGARAVVMVKDGIRLPESARWVSLDAARAIVSAPTLANGKPNLETLDRFFATPANNGVRVAIDSPQTLVHLGYEGHLFTIAGA